jgi:oligoendopeptidase F
MRTAPVLATQGLQREPTSTIHISTALRSEESSKSLQYDRVMTEAALAAPALRDRDEIPDRFKWDLHRIFSDWDAWQRGYAELDKKIGDFAALQGTLALGADRLLAAMRLSDEVGQLEYKVWYFAALRYDEDQRDNTVNARVQQVQILFAKAAQAVAWFEPELLNVPLATAQEWMASNPDLATYRFAIEDLYRRQEHVLDEKGERLLSLSSRFSSSPHDTYAAISTADVKYPTIELSDGVAVTLTYGQYRAILATNRSQADRGRAFQEFHGIYERNLNTYASLYNGVLQRDWFLSQAREYPTTLEAALHGNNIPAAVVENLIATTKKGAEPLRRYHRLRKRALGLETYHSYDTAIPLVEFDRKYAYEASLEWLPQSVAALGPDYQRDMRAVLEGQCIDVYENPGKKSGAYSAPVYGVQPYMLLNYNDTLDAVFTLAHEMGHSMHTVLAHRAQPFVYAGYTIFVAEVPSTLSEAQAHGLVEEGKPVTADVLGDIYFDLLKTYHGDALDYDTTSRATWARIPHFFSTPYYVYQYATCFASSAQLMKEMTSGPAADRQAAVKRYLALLEAGGSDHPMTLLQRAGVDLSKPEAVLAVGAQLDQLVTKLEEALNLTSDF